MNRFPLCTFTGSMLLSTGVSSLTSMRKICPKLLLSGQVFVHVMNSVIHIVPNPTPDMAWKLYTRGELKNDSLCFVHTYLWCLNSFLLLLSIRN